MLWQSAGQPSSSGCSAWYGNLLWILGLFFGFIRKPLQTGISGALALALACTVFAAIGKDMPADEGNVNRTMIVHILPGCYVWMASFAVLPIGAMFKR